MMKNINFHKVEMKNFCGYTDPMEFTFENSKITLISGKNGIGKTTVFSAIPFALFGVTQTGQTASDVLNNKSEKNCEVRCHFSIDDVKYTAIRGIKSPKAAVKAALFIEGNRDPIAKGAREVTSTIEELIVSKELFFNTVLFGQNVKSFFTDLPDSKQKEIFRKILQLDEYVKYQHKCSEIITSLSDKVLNTEQQIAIKESLINALNETNNGLLEINKTKEKDKKNLLNEIDKVLIAISNEDKELIALNKESVQHHYDNSINRQTLINSDMKNLHLLKESKINELSATFESKIFQIKELHSNEISVIKDDLNNKIEKEREYTTQILQRSQEALEILRDTYTNKKAELVDRKNNNQTCLLDKRHELTTELQNNITILNDNFRNDIKEYEQKCAIKIRECKESKDPIKQKINLDITNKREVITAFNNKIEKEKLQITFSEDNIVKYKKAISSKVTQCPTCFQKWDNVSHIDNMIQQENSIIEKCNSMIVGYREEIKSLKDEISDLDIRLDNINLEINDIISNIESKYDKLCEELKKTTENKIIESQHVLAEQLKICDEEEKNIENMYNNDLRDLEERLKIIADEHKTDISVEQNKLQDKIDQLKKESSDIIDILESKMNQSINDINTRKESNFSKLDLEYDSKQAEFDNELIEIKKELSKIAQQMAVIQSVENKIKLLNTDINQYTNNVSVLESSIQDNLDNISSNDDKMSDHKKEIEIIKSEISDDLKHKDICQFWKNAFSSSGIPSMLIDESIPFMNREIAKYLEQMSNGRYVITFDTLHETKSGEFRDKISINVYDAVTHSNSRVNLSGGQTKLVDIATILTLSSLQENVQKFKTNILLFDEIFDALDDDNIANVSNMLRRVCEDKSINIITHRHIDQVEADNVYNFGS